MFFIGALLLEANKIVIIAGIRSNKFVQLFLDFYYNFENFILDFFFLLILVIGFVYNLLFSFVVFLKKLLLIFFLLVITFW